MAVHATWNTSANYPRLWPGPPSTERWLWCKFSDILEAMSTPVEGVRLLVLNRIGNTRRYSSNAGDQWPGCIRLFRVWMWMFEVLKSCEQCWRLSRWMNSGLGRVDPKWKHQCNCKDNCKQWFPARHHGFADPEDVFLPMLSLMMN